MAGIDFLICELNGNLFGINEKYIFQLINVVEFADVKTKLSYLKGMINYHNEEIPVIDLSKRLGYEKAVKIGLDTPIIIINIKKHKFGVLIDNVLSIINIDNNKIKTEDLNIYQFSEFIEGYSLINNVKDIKKDSKKFFILDIEKLMN